MCEGNKAKNWKGGRRIDKNGYVLIYSPDHPYVSISKTVREHRLVIEKHIGRFLLPSEVVHHRNGIKSDNRIDNLELFNNHGEHIKTEYKNGSMENSKKTQFKKGMTSWLKGKKMSEEYKAKVIKYLTPFKKGHLGYWLGKKRPNFRREAGYKSV